MVLKKACSAQAFFSFYYQVHISRHRHVAVFVAKKTGPSTFVSREMRGERKIKAGS